MTIKSLARGRYNFTDTALSQNNVEKVVIITASSKILLKEMRLAVKGGTNLYVNVYILKSGGDDSFNYMDYGFDDLAWDFGVFVLKLAITSPENSYTITALNKVMESGDALKMSIANRTGGTVNVTSYGVNLWLTGDEQ